MYCFSAISFRELSVRALCFLEGDLNTVNLIRNICSLSDGPVGESTGTPYIYATPLEISFHDLKVNPQASITMSLAQVHDNLKGLASHCIAKLKPLSLFISLDIIAFESI